MPVHIYITEYKNAKDFQSCDNKLMMPSRS